MNQKKKTNEEKKNKLAKYTIRELRERMTGKTEKERERVRKRRK